MASRKPKAEPIEQIHAPDYDLAVRLYREDIKPAQGKVGEFSQEMSTAYKAIKKRAHIQPQAARAVFRLDSMEPSKRDDYLRSFNGLLKRLGIFMPVDMVDAAEGKGALGEEVVPTGTRARPKLATIQGGKGDTPPAQEPDLADGADPTSATDNAKAAVGSAGDEDVFGIVNTRTGEWLVDEDGGDDGWSNSATDAAAWTHAGATKIVEEFEVPSGDTLALRRIGE